MEGEIVIKEAIGSGETIEIALKNACAELGIDSTEADDYEVIQQPEKKKLGLFGGKDAKVKVIVNVKDEVVSTTETTVIENEDVKTDVVAVNAGESSPAKVAAEYLQNILNALGLTEIKMTINDIEGGAEINLEGEDIGYVIGRRGDTLNALQYLTGLVANHVENNYFRISINTGDYREKREKTLAILGRKLAFKAVKTGMRTSLEPMNPYERRIIHTSVQKVRGAISWSEGENMNRHVVIGPDPDAPKKNYNNRNRYNNRGRRGGYNSGESTTSTPTREPINEGSLYGKL